MALHDEVLSDIRARILPRRFKVRHLMSRPDPNQQGRYLVGNQSYSERSLKVIPANHSISDG